MLKKMMIGMGFFALGAGMIITSSAAGQQVEDEQSIQRLEQRIDELEAVQEGNPHNPHDPPRYEWVSPLRWETDDERFSMAIKGRIQPRYEYIKSDGSDTSEFTFRRIRLDFQGHAFMDNLTYRIMPEMQGGYSLRDAWVDYEYTDGHALRAGQYNIPAFFERSVSSNRHALQERSLANDTFQWPTGGRDIGLMSHGSVERLRYGVGFFGGEGRNDEADSTSGHMFSARTSYTILGDYPRSLNLVEPIDGSNLAVGLGGYYTNKNALADINKRNRWNHSPEVFDVADVGSYSGDITFQHGRMTASLQGFYWEVDPRNNADRFYGTGYTAEAGCLIIPETLFAGYRHSWANPNRRDRDERMRENTLGLQWYLEENRSKFYIEHSIVGDSDDGSWARDRITRVQYQFLF